MGFWKHAFAIDEKTEHSFTDEEKDLIRRLAEKIVKHGLSVPGILFIESARPLNFITSQAMAWFEPIVTGLFSWEDYEKFRMVLERRGSVELIIKAIEDAEAERSAEIAKLKSQKRPGLIVRTFRRIKGSSDANPKLGESKSVAPDDSDKGEAKSLKSQE